MTQLTANMEWLYTEAGDDRADRIRAAASDGFTAVEIWGWRTKDLDRIADALSETGVELRSLIVDPQLNLTDPTQLQPYLAAVGESLTVANRLQSSYLVAVAGAELDGTSRAAQHEAVVQALREAARILQGSNVTIILEPLNSAVDHPGTYLTSTREGLDIVQEVDSPNVKLLLDLYHSLMMGEDPREMIHNRVDLIGHVQIADIPGRHEPGTGTVRWSTHIDTLRELGYDGDIGLEYKPTLPTKQSTALVRETITE